MTFKVNAGSYNRATKKFLTFVNKTLPRKALKVFKKNTPIGESGLKNARNNTNLKTESDGFTISGDYDYSGVIDRGEYPNPPQKRTGKTRNGYSTQSPKGMIKPTVDYVRDEVTKNIRSNS